MSDPILSKPTALRPVSENIPASLKQKPIWCCWYYDPAPKKADGTPPKKPWTKVPYSAEWRGNGKSTDSKSWCHFEKAFNIFDQGNEVRVKSKLQPHDYKFVELSGVGINLFGNTQQLVGVDLDNCVEAGQVTPWATEIIQYFKSYTEFSPSGVGIRIFVYGSNTGERNKKGDVELYDSTDRRYLTMTGHRLDGANSEVVHNQSAIDRLIKEYLQPEPSESLPKPPSSSLEGGLEVSEGNDSRFEKLTSIADRIDWATIFQKASTSKNGDKFKLLYQGDLSGAGFDDPSAADLSFCNLLAFWLGHNKERIDEVFRESRLCREKWGRDDYRDRTIEKAISQSNEVFDWSDFVDDPSFDCAELYAASTKVEAVRTANVPKVETAKAIDTLDDKAAKKTQFQLLMALISDVAVWRSDDEDFFAALEYGDHHENVRLASSQFKYWCINLFFETYGSAIGRDGLQQVVDHLSSMAMKKPPVTVFQRVARIGNTIWIDLGSESWDAIELNADGWRIVRNPPVKFKRTSNTGCLPIPSTGGNIDDLKPLCATTDAGWILLKGWLLQCFQGFGPYVVAIINGEQGSAKSSVCTLMKRFVDPLLKGEKSSIPRDEKALAVDCKSEFALLYDNVSYLAPWVSDALCRVATGGGLKDRKLYSDGEQVVFDVCAPIILNGIPDFADNGDLMSRSLIVTQPVIHEDERKTEAMLRLELAGIESSVMGGLCDLICQGLRNYDSMAPLKLPRMADSVKWISACPGSNEFLEKFNTNQELATDLGIEASPIASGIKELLKSTTNGRMPGTWDGTHKELLTQVTLHTKDTSYNKNFPANPKQMSNRLRRDAPLLRKQGIDISYRDSNGKNLVVIQAI